LLKLKNFIFSFLNRIWRLVCSLFWAGLWVFGVGLLFWYPLRWWPSDHLWPVRLTNYLMPWLLLGLIPGLLAAGLARRKWLVVTLTIPTILIGGTFAPLFLPRPGTVLAGSTPIKIMSFNVLYNNQDYPALAGVIRQENPDILLLQEITEQSAAALEAELRDLYPDGRLYHDFADKPGQAHYFSEAIFSRYPITPISVTYERGRAQKVLINTPDGPISVWNVHPTTPMPWAYHYRQIYALTEDIAAVNGPLIVGGDFNTTDHSETYRLVNQHLGNAHWDAGWGFGFSFPAHAPRVKGVPLLTRLVRIDHIFYSHHFFVHNARTLPHSGGSDHLPVVAELSLVK
jgi:endonuclease/exonuclease/phosphatase (EEP) superfamily protein YafD